MQVKKYTYFFLKYKKYLHKNNNKCIIMQSKDKTARKRVLRTCVNGRSGREAQKHLHGHVFCYMIENSYF